MLTKLVPIVVAIVLSFYFKNTRWVGIIGVAVISYFYPVPFLVMGSASGIAFGCYKLWNK
jgi:hypothetical protein